MIHKRIFMRGLIVAAASLLVLAAGCDSTQTYHPQFIINVDIDEATYPVDGTHKLYATFYVNPDFDLPWITVYSFRKQIVTPELNIGDYPLYFEVWYDADNSGTLTTGDSYKGWNGKTDRTSQTLDPLLTTDTEIMLLNFDFSAPGTF